MFKHYVQYQIKCVTLHNTKNIGTGKNSKHVLGFLHYVAAGRILKQLAVLPHPQSWSVQVQTDLHLCRQGASRTYHRKRRGQHPSRPIGMLTGNCNKQFSVPELQPTPDGTWCKNFFQRFCLCVHHTQECLIFLICGHQSIKNGITICKWLADETLINVSTLIKYFKNLDWIRMC